MIRPVVVQHTFGVSPQRLFAAWLRPQTLQRFLVPDPGVKVRAVRVDPTVGGRFSLEMVAGDTVMPIHGEYRVLEPPRRLVFSWLSGHTTAESVVTLTFEPTEAGTVLTLHHTGFPTESAGDDHDGGWTHILRTLATLQADPT